ncbi:MAG TPA: TolC family protein [Terriglobales bacterium]|nr:TolC family protein [Terriglobales bacterium]
MAKWARTAVVGVALGLAVAAQAPAPAPGPLTLNAALAYAAQHYPAVQAALARVSGAEAGVALAQTAYLPQLNGVYQDSRGTQNQVSGLWLPTAVTPTLEGALGGASGASYWGSQGGALLSWEPFDFGLRAADVGQAEAAAAKSRGDLAVTRLQVESAVGDYFLLALANQQTVVAAQANVQRWQQVDQAVGTEVASGLKPGVDAARAEAELARAKTELYQAEQGASMARDLLAALLGAAGTALRLDAGRLLQPPAAAALPGAGVGQHPLALDQQAAVAEAQAQAKVVGRTDYPRFLVQAEGLARGSGVPDAATGGIHGVGSGLLPARGNWVAGVTVVLPDLFGFRARGQKMQQARAATAAATARYQQTVQELTGQQAAARDQLQAAQQVAAEMPIELRAAREAEGQSRTRYQAGLATMVEVAEAEGLLAQAERDEALARLQVWRALLGVAEAQGDLAPLLQLAGGH